MTANQNDALVEAVARAIVYANMIDVDFSDAEARFHAYEIKDDDWMQWKAYAEAAIAAIRAHDAATRAAFEAECG